MSTTVANASSSRFAPSIPIRAITSTIASRSTQSLPPASQAYEPLVKSLFRHRLKYVLLLSSLTTWLVESIWAWWAVCGSIVTAGIWSRVAVAFSPSLLLLSLLSWTTVALPVIVLRKVFLTPRRSGTTSPHSTIKTALAQNSTRIAFITYLASATASLAIHVIMAYNYEALPRGDPRLSLFVKSRKHPHYLNGRLVFLLVSQLITSVAFTLRGAMTDRFAYRWSYAISKNTPRSLVITVAFVISLVNSAISILGAGIVFITLRISLPILYKIPLLSILLRPFTAHFLRGQWTLLLPFGHLTLIFRALCLATSTFLVWELSDTLFEHIISEPTPVSAFSADPNTTLVSGITSPDRIYKFFAYAELKDLSTDTQSATSASRRTSLFGDQKTPLNLWSTLARESLLLLGHDYQLFLRRGQPPPPPPPPAPLKAKVIPNPKGVSPAPLLRQRIFRDVQEPPVQAALDVLASDGPLAKVADVGASQVPELFRSVESRVLRSPVAEEAKKGVSEVAKKGSLGVNLDLNSHLKGLLNFDSLVGRSKAKVKESAQGVWKKYGRKEVSDRVVWFLEWWAEERKSRVVDASLPYRELDVVVIDVLSHLVCASLTEDTYGTVQRDIPRILEALVSFLIAVEEYQIEISALQSSVPPNTSLSVQEQYERNALSVEIFKAHEVLGYMGDGLKEGIARIVRTFGDKLLAFRFPPRIAGKLQVFVDYSAVQ